MSALDIETVPVLNDNYVHLLHDRETGRTAAVDPAVAGPVLEALEGLGWSLDMVLVTHPHGDHTGGIAELKSRFPELQVYAAAGDLSAVPAASHAVKEGDQVPLGGSRARVLDVPGHTAHHVAYWFEEAGALFPGDTLFSLGCGRLFGGTAEQMWESLKKLRALPAETQVYPAHEYTNANADFALTIEADNADLQARAGEVLKLREAGQPTIPSTMASERACNPFLRADEPTVQAAAGMAGGEASAVFAEIRRRKDHF